MTASQKTKAVRKVLGAESSQTRIALINAAERLLREEGYAAVTSRRIAAAAGLKHQVIYYYFETLEDLLLEVYRRGAAKGTERLREALDSEDPLRSLWEFICAPRGTRFITESMALAIRNDAIRAEIAKDAEATRSLQAEVLARHLESRGVKSQISPVLLSLLMNALARNLVNEELLGIKLGHDEAFALVEGCLRELGSETEPVKAAQDFLAKAKSKAKA